MLNASYIQCKQIRLNINIRQYLETGIIANRVLRIKIKNFPYQKSCKLAVDTQSYSVDFAATNR